MPDDLEEGELYEGDNPDLTTGAGDGGEATESGGWRYADGREVDAEGNDVEAITTPTIEAEIETPPVVEARTPAAPAAATPQRREIYSWEATKRGAFTPEELTMLADWDLNNPAKAQEFRFDRFETLKQRLTTHANNVWKQEVADFRKSHPSVWDDFKDDIQDARDQLSVEQRQTSGIVREIAAEILRRSDDYGGEDALERVYASIKAARSGAGAAAGAKAVPAKAAEPAKPAKAVIPPAARVPGPSAAPAAAPRAATQPGTKSGTFAYFKKLLPHYSDKEIREHMSGLSDLQGGRNQ